MHATLSIWSQPKSAVLELHLCLAAAAQCSTEGTVWLIVCAAGCTALKAEEAQDASRQLAWRSWSLAYYSTAIRGASGCGPTGKHLLAMPVHICSCSA